MNNLWLICSKCGFNASIPQDQLKEWQNCPNCRGKLVLDVSQGNLGDNFPILDKDKIYEIGEIKLNKKAYAEFAEIEQINKSIPIISRKEILEFVIDINLKTTKELFNI